MPRAVGQYRTLTRLTQTYNFLVQGLGDKVHALPGVFINRFHVTDLKLLKSGRSFFSKNTRAF